MRYSFWLRWSQLKTWFDHLTFDHFRHIDLLHPTPTQFKHFLIWSWNLFINAYANSKNIHTLDWWFKYDVIILWKYLADMYGLDIVPCIYTNHKKRNYDTAFILFLIGHLGLWTWSTQDSMSYRILILQTALKM